MTALKPCPFCGGKAEMIPLTIYKEYYVQCTKCGIEQGRLYKSCRTATEAWNRRKESVE